MWPLKSKLWPIGLYDINSVLFRPIFRTPYSIFENKSVPVPFTHFRFQKFSVPVPFPYIFFINPYTYRLRTKF